MEILHSFKSSSIKWAAYDAENRVLHVQFKDNDSEYEYEEVAAKEWLALEKAKSKGQYINFYIKPFHKVSNPQ